VCVCVRACACAYLCVIAGAYMCLCVGVCALVPRVLPLDQVLHAGTLIIVVLAREGYEGRGHRLTGIAVVGFDLH
jgi:hypothetical protein